MVFILFCVLSHACVKLICTAAQIAASCVRLTFLNEAST